MSIFFINIIAKFYLYRRRAKKFSKFPEFLKNSKSKHIRISPISPPRQYGYQIKAYEE
jgi:hypothetical protein